MLLDYNIKFKNIILKIDTEGHELNVLKGASNLLKSNSLKRILLELRLKNIKTYNPSELINFLYDKNFLWDEVLHIGHRNSGPNYIDLLFRKKISK